MAKVNIEGWRNDQRMVFLANPGRDLTKNERLEWERGIRKYQVYTYPNKAKKQV